MLDVYPLLKPGDCLLYKPKGIFGRLIAIKTWHKISHVEVYDGEGYSWASRDGQGVNLYSWRDSELAYVLHPTMGLNLDAARTWASSMVGTPYGWADLLNFIAINVNKKGIVCSPFVTEFYRHAGWNIFPTDESNDVAPFEFLSLVGNGFTVIYDAHA